MHHPQQIFVAVIGTGGVGKCFLNQLAALSSKLSRSASAQTYVSVILLARSNKLLFSESFRSLNLSTWEKDLEQSKAPVLSLPQIAEYLAIAPAPVVLVDNTSNEAVAHAYPTFLRKGIHVITPNKKAFSSELDLWEDIQAASLSRNGGMVFHESSVGAGLPVISTLRELIDTGDEVTKIEGVFSGTMSYLFNTFAPIGAQGGSWSAAVKQAKELGFTEPDPRDDLNGLDVARKLTILGRIIGLPIASPTSFPVESLIPKDLESCGSSDEFLSKLSGYDGEMEKLKKEAEAEGKVIRYVGKIETATNQVKVGLEKFDPTHPIAALKGSANIINFYTKRYGDAAVTIQGAGAGGEVTAAGVTGDLIKILQRLK
ncbi:putative homoserine dehydrogenase [Xylona heveae TC161]|uniref:Homoserine dehydrogenase n=1 Tax=Xylona heveae (strain CBS 132557 / TC161) TaxID=1328760 RepID=A0A165FIC8_XYLHT|nr:putative homoserine dehydrogenase [Xylona heveae TC161]KZF21011.1 putative homoserine dehydrogenase [Xylona heveae TC161]